MENVLSLKESEIASILSNACTEAVYTVLDNLKIKVDALQTNHHSSEAREIVKEILEEIQESYVAVNIEVGVHPDPAPTYGIKN